MTNKKSNSFSTQSKNIQFYKMHNGAMNKITFDMYVRKLSL